METSTVKQDLVELVKNLNLFKRKLKESDVEKKETLDVINTTISKLNKHIDYCKSKEKVLQRQFYDRDKLHVVYYINVEALTVEDAENYVTDIYETVNDGNDGSVINTIIQVRGEHFPPVEYHFPPYQPKKKSDYVNIK